MINSIPAVERFDAIAERRRLDNADLRWLTGPHGLLAVLYACSQANDFSRLDGGVIEWMADELDDLMIDVPGSLPSQRMHELIAVARAAARRRGAGVGAAPTREALPIDADGELTRFFRGEPVKRASTSSSLVLLSRHAHGEVARLTMTSCDGRTIAPDLLEAPFFRADAEATEAVARAASLAGVSGVRWMVSSSVSGVPLNTVSGASLGLAAAMACGSLGKRHASLPPDWAFTGRLNAEGRVESLLKAGVSEYTQKLGSARDLTVVVPSDDVAHVEQLLPSSNARRVLGVGSVGEAERLVARHAEGAIEYQHALSRGSARVRRTQWALRVLLGFAACAFVAWYTWHRHEASVRDDRRNEAAGESFLFEPADGSMPSFRMDKTEVSNQQYAICIAEHGCSRPLNEEIRRFDRKENGPFPVTGVSAAQAEKFCEWAHKGHGRLPTLEQWRYVGEHAVASEFPYRKGDVPTIEAARRALPREPEPVASALQLRPTQPAWLVGNVFEWSRTACQVAGACRALTRVADSPSLFIRVLGASFALLEEQEPQDRTWFDVDAAPYLLRAPDLGAPDIGFRCTKEQQ